MTSQSSVRSVRHELLDAAVDLLDEHGPDALQTRKVAGAAGTSTMAVYTHFGGMQPLIDAVAEEGLRQFDEALTMPPTDDPVADLVATGVAYRRYAIERPHMYRLMFGSTSAHGINASTQNVLTQTVAEICLLYTSGPSADRRRLWVRPDSGLFWSMNCDSWLVPKNSLIAATTGRMLIRVCGVIASTS